MYPLLISGITSVASNLLDRFTRPTTSPTPPDAAKFQALLDQVLKTAKNSTSPTPANSTQSLLDHCSALRDQLLNAPEVRATLDSADPSKPLSLSLSPDGRLLAQSPGGEVKSLPLSPENTAKAQELARLLSPAPPSSASIPRNFALSPSPLLGRTAKNLGH